MTLTLTLTLGSDSLILKPNNQTVRSPISFIKSAPPTARGVSVFEGVTARPDLYIWNVKTRMREWEYIKLRRMIATLYALFETAPATAFMALKDEYERLNSLEYNKNGRTTVTDSALTVGGETTYFCNFKVFAEIPEQGGNRLDPWVTGLLGTVEVTLILREVV